MYISQPIRLIVTFVLLIFSSASCLAADTSTSFSTAPNFELHSPLLPPSLADLKGKVVYVDFWASWCKPCRQSFPWMNKMQQKYQEAGLQVIAINLDAEQSSVEKFLSAVPADMPIVYDPQGLLAQEYHVIGMPSSYLIDKKGNLRFAHKGFFSAKQSQYEQQINTLLNETE